MRQPIQSDDGYDVLPYPSMPITYAQPAHLAALGILFGMVPPAVDHARSLELGCASGGNIIPLAARFPSASFLGIDLSHRHISDGRKRIAKCALQNVQLRQDDLTTIDLSGEQFDYVICHGVFSWVPRATQDAILGLCRDALAPNGLATISYNVLPGWHMRHVIRDLCLYYAGKDGTPQSRVAKARVALEQIAECTDDTEPYGHLLRTEARRLKRVPSSYMLGEFLALENTPCYVQDFIQRAKGFGLDFLCEADLFDAVPQTLDAATRNRITSLVAPDRLAQEQQIDYITGRLFRRSVLVRQQTDTAPRRVPRPDQLSFLHIASPIRPDGVTNENGTIVFKDERERPITVKDPTIGHALKRLGAAFPKTLSCDELLGGTQMDPKAKPEDAERLRHAIFTMVLAGRASISVLPLQVGNAADEWPKAWRFAQIEAMSGQPWITSLRHVGIPMHPVLLVLLPYLDGTHARPELRALLFNALERGVVQVPELPGDQPLPLRETIDALAGTYLDWSLSYLARHALLVPVMSQGVV